MHWTTYLVDIDDLRYLFSSAEEKEIRQGGVCIYNDHHRESTFDFLLEQAMENAILERSGQTLRPLLRKSNCIDLGKYYYDLVGYQFEQRMRDILDTRLIHHTPGEMMKVFSAGSTLFIARRQLHLR